MDIFTYISNLPLDLEDKNAKIIEIEKLLNQLNIELSKRNDKFGFYLTVYAIYKKLDKIFGRGCFPWQRKNCAIIFPPAYLSLGIVAPHSVKYVKIHDLPTIVGLKILQELRKESISIFFATGGKFRNIDHLFADILNYDLNKVRWRHGSYYSKNNISDKDICEPENLAAMQERFDFRIEQVDRNRGGNNNINFILTARFNALKESAPQSEKNPAISQ